VPAPKHTKTRDVPIPNRFQNQVEKAKEPEKKQLKAEEVLPVVGAVALVVAVGAYIWKKKPWKGSGGAPATA
jgi:hypothetical protein